MTDPIPLANNPRPLPTAQDPASAGSIQTAVSPRDAFVEKLSQGDSLYAAAVLTGNVSENELLAVGQREINQGGRNLEGAMKAAKELRSQYEKDAKFSGSAKWATLIGETALMGIFGYDTISQWTGLKPDTWYESIGAAAVNSSVSGTISAFRTWSSYMLMEQAYESFQKGNPTRGVLAASIGVGLAALHSAFVAFEFADSTVNQELQQANDKLTEIGVQEQAIRAEMAAERQSLSDEIAAIDKRIQELGSGDGAKANPQVANLDQESRDLLTRKDALRDNPLYRDNKLEDWDREAEREFRRIDARVAQIQVEKNALLKAAGVIDPATQSLIDSSTQTRLQLNQQLNRLEEQFQTRFDSLGSQRTFWNAKVQELSPGANSSGWTFMQTPEILVKSFASGAAISILNWGAAALSIQQRDKEAILAGAPDPWGRKAENNGADLRRKFMGYDVGSPNNEEHLRHEAQLKELASAVSNPHAMRAELRGIITDTRNGIVAKLGEGVQARAFSTDEYGERLKGVNTAYQNALAKLDDPDVIAQMQQMMSRSVQAVREAEVVVDEPVAVRRADSKPVPSAWS